MQFAGVPDSLVQKEQFFRQRLAALDAARFDAEQTENDAPPQNERYVLKNAYEAFLAELAQRYPRYYQLKYGARSPDIATVQAQLGPQQIAYSYFMGAKAIYIFRIAPDQANGYLVENGRELQTALQDWIAFVSQAPSAQAPSAALVQAGQSLGKKLLPQLPPATNSLLIIPGGMLGYLPFESLLLETPSELRQYQRWDYLGQAFSLSYAYAAEIWLQGKQSQQKASSYLGFAPDFSTGLLSETRSAWGALAHNQEEVETGARLFGGQALIGELAQESAVKQLGRRSNILHFATHALGDNESELDSYLQLSQNNDEHEDGRLHTYEIYGLHLNSPLTVLSACQTAHGPLLEGEGIMSLARAFQYAGSEQVLTTLWQADDQAGASLTTAFLAAVAEGEATAQALQSARQQWLSEADNVHGHPYYWAGFVLIGDGEEIRFGSSVMIWILMALLGGGGLVAAMVWFSEK
jgi:CHAT domain-containing protein